MRFGRAEPVTRHRRVQDGEDRYGNPVYRVESTEVDGARFAPKDTIPAAEPGREPVVVEPTLYWHNQWPDIVESDRLTVRGITYEVHGVPAEWRGATVGGLAVKLRETLEGVP